MRRTRRNRFVAAIEIIERKPIMSIHQASPSETDREQWLKVYYFVRAAVSFA